MKIIIKTPNFIGDTIMTTPAIELIKQEYPSAKFTIVCKKSSLDVFCGRDDIEKLIVDDTKSGNRILKTISLIKKIRKEKYDIAFLFHNTFIDALVFKFSKVKTIVGYSTEGRKFLLDFHQKINRARHYVSHYAHLVNSFFGYKYSTHSDLVLFPQKSSLLDSLDKSKTTIGFVLGGTNKANRALPLETGKDLMHILSKEFDCNIVLLGDKEDCDRNDVYESCLKETNTSYINLSGKTSVKDFISCINSLDILVTIDTSAMHIAAAVKTRFIVLKGCSTSAFDIVKPKVDFGIYIDKSSNFIEDASLISQITAKEIVNELKICI